MTNNYEEIELRNWDSEACVRSRPHRYKLPKCLAEMEQSQDWFPRSMLPFLSHPELSNQTPNTIQIILAKHLIYFMEYTTKLEHRIVNRAVEAMTHHDLGFNIPSSMKLSALQLYTDEGYHALIAYEISTQVQSLYGLTQKNGDPKRITDLELLIEHEIPERRNILSILVGFVSETIIAKELSLISRHSLFPAIYEMLRDHLDDEAKHSRFFSKVFLYIWKSSSPEQQDHIQKSLKSILNIFFITDTEWLSNTLSSSGISCSTITEIIQHLSSQPSISQRIASNASVTLRIMQKAGIDLAPEL